MSLFEKLHVFLYRLTKGRVSGRMLGVNMLLLITLDHKSGKDRTSRLWFSQDKANYILFVLNRGVDRKPSWYLDILSHPQVTIEVRDKKMKSVAEVATGEAHIRLWNVFVANSPNKHITAQDMLMVVLKPIARV